MTRVCSIAGCPSPHAARGACKDHYNDWYSGKIELPDPTEIRTHYSDPEECFAARTKRVGDHLIWTGPLSCGQGRISVGGRQIVVRRYAWMREHGPIPAGRAVRLTCDRRDCVSVEHMTAPHWGQAPAAVLSVPDNADEPLPISVNPIDGGYVAEVGDVYREVFPTFALAAAGAMEASARHMED